MTEEKQRGNLHATLALSQEEARSGTERTITLPDGRKVSLFIYPGAYSGQKIHLAGRGDFTTDGTVGDLIITLTVPSANSFEAQPFVSNASDAKMNSIYPTPSPHSPAYQSAMRPPYTPPVPSSEPLGPHQSYYTPAPPFRIFPQQQRLLSMERSPLMTAATVILVLMLLIGGSLVLYTTVYVPHKASYDATATAIAQATQIAKANATASAQQAATATAIDHATATAIAQAQNDYTTIISSMPYLNDPLQTSYVTSWDINSNCRFTGGAYHAASSALKTIALCLATYTRFSNFAFQIHMNILKGDGGGIVFRADANSSQNYLLKISPNGNYEFDYYPDQTGKSAQAIASDSSTSLKAGLNQDNPICVIARGDTINFYFNGQYITTAKDGSLTSGQIGVTADDGTNATEVAYTQAQVWIL
jgi:hypothetical protein